MTVLINRSRRCCLKWACFLPCSSIRMEMIEEEKIIQSYKHCSSFMKSNLRPLCLICLLQSTFYAPCKLFPNTAHRLACTKHFGVSCSIYFSTARPSPTSLWALRCDLSTLSSSSTRSSCSGGLSKHIIPPPAAPEHCCLAEMMHFPRVHPGSDASICALSRAIRLPTQACPHLNCPVVFTQT